MAYPSATDIEAVNDALARIAQAPISSFDENSVAGRAVKRLYPRVRALMFAGGDWSFATARAQLDALLDEDVYPWRYEYAMPAGVARVRMVVQGTPGLDHVGTGPRPYEQGFSVASGLRVIRTDANPATLVYTCEIEDSSLWDRGFFSAFTVQLAAELCLPLTGNGQLAQAISAEAQRAIMVQMPQSQVQSVTAAGRGPSTTTAARG